MIDTLTKEMLQYIEEHPVITLGGGASFEPFLIQNEDGTVGGYDADLLSLVSERTGLRIEYELGLWKEIQSKAEKGQLDGLCTVIYPMPEERKIIYFSSKPYGSFSNVVFVEKGRGAEFETPESLVGKKIAIQKGNISFETAFESLGIDAEIVYTDDVYGMIRAVVSGEADFTILDETAYYVASLIGLGGLIESSFFVGDPFQISLAVRKDEPILLDILNLGLDSISRQEKYEIRKKWFSIGESELESSGMAFFSQEEKRFLSQNRSFDVSVAHLVPPILIKEKGRPLSGIVSDYISLLESKTGLDIRMVENEGSSPLSVMPGDAAMANPEYDHFYQLFSFPMVVVTDEYQLFVENLNDHLDKTFIVLDSFPLMDELDSRGIRYISTPSLEDAFDMVRKNRAFALIAPSATVAYEIQREHRFDLHISGVIQDMTLEYVLALEKGAGPLSGIMEKAVDSFTEDEINGVRNKWSSFKFEQRINTRLIVLIVSGMLSIIAAVLLWNRTLSASKKKTQKAYDELQVVQTELQRLAVCDQLTGLFNRNKLDGVIDHAFLLQSRYKHDFGVIILDVDLFKKVNDSFGHNAGDQVLRDMAKILTGNIRESDILGRWGGEEFLIYCPQVNEEGLVLLGERLRKAVESHSFSSVGTITISLGGAIVNNSDQKESLIARADAALYESKRNGRNRFHFGA